jgi:hypothetical protein
MEGGGNPERCGISNDPTEKVGIEILEKLAVDEMEEKVDAQER